ncbi:MAG TPA: tRNA (adenosine(37)-N6)-dimethylallyltransferase MiaA [Saprospiraceae bacterium]|nr:tRNA (adenosine(37)-N6)-dimethylallyltransferase MiaA [Saprospiraceae bacterium]HPN69056.1 tRNA (adenosine(37)-N6)-dimethylallyltransferase MiaA [Saprospiraceae bacterium]
MSGPTASGKTNLGIEIAQYLQCPIISADSRQIYKELEIGVAKPNRQQLDQTEHHLISEVSISEVFDTAKYVEVVLDRMNSLFKKHNHLILVGGTGLYIDALLYGIDDMPTNDPLIADELQQSFSSSGIGILQEELKAKDPVYFQKVDRSNHVRLMRALNVIRQTNKPFSDFRNRQKITRPFDFMHFNIDIPRAILYERIDCRVDEMINDGLESEVKSLINYKDLQALQTVGYSEWWPYFEGFISQAEVIEKIKQHTRNYAKRQVTWFKKRENISVPWSASILEMKMFVINHLEKK